MRHRPPRFRRVLTAIAGSTVTLLAAPALADDVETPWPELRYGRMAPVAVTSRPSLSAGAAVLFGAIEGHAAFSAALAAAYTHPLPRGVGVHGAFVATQAVRDGDSTTAVGNARLGATWRRGAWRLAGGLDLWVGEDGLGGWPDAASPWGAIAWRGGRWTVGAGGAWDRSDELAPFSPTAAWSERARPGANATVFARWHRSRLTIGLGGGVTADDGEVTHAWATGELAVPFRYELGTVTPMAVVRTPAGAGAQSPPPAVGAVVRVDFDAAALVRELFPSREEKQSEPFDPFGDS